jgi:hypothetical protein
MVQPMLLVHWKQARLLLFPFIVAAFGLPLLVVQGFGGGGDEQPVSLEAYRILASYQVWLPYFPMLAAAVGGVVALTAWNWDHHLGHVYALSLPVSRWEYVMLKMGAGAVLLLVPVIALWLGAHVASASITIPEGLRSYPNQLAFRFFAATMIAYSLFFAMGAGTIRTTLWIVGAVFAFIIGGNLMTTMLELYMPTLERVNVVQAVIGWLLRAGGPFAVFTGNWTLIDV